MRLPCLHVDCNADVEMEVESIDSGWFQSGVVAWVANECHPEGPRCAQGCRLLPNHVQQLVDAAAWDY